jgi:hypothetical protein
MGDKVTGFKGTGRDKVTGGQSDRYKGSGGKVNGEKV